MLKNVAGQDIGSQILIASSGLAFTSTVTVYVTVDGGTQTIGSVGSGICTHEGNGYHSYLPATAETDGDHIAYTFIGTLAAPATVQVYPDITQIGIILGACGSTSLTTSTCSSDLTGYTANQLNGRLITFYGGPADGEQASITAFAVTNGVLTFDTLTLAPENTDAFKIT